MADGDPNNEDEAIWAPEEVERLVVESLENVLADATYHERPTEKKSHLVSRLLGRPIGKPILKIQVSRLLGRPMGKPLLRDDCSKAPGD